MRLDPKEFGLHPRTKLEQRSSDEIAIVIERKSRIIMADGKRIAEKAEKIREKQPASRVVLQTTAPVCSKTVAYLESKGVQLL